MKKKKVKNNNTKEKSTDKYKEVMNISILIFITICFLCISIYLGNNSEDINLNLPFKKYYFEASFNPSENIILNQFRIYYKFNQDSNKGYISFMITEINESITTKSFEIEIPPELNITDVNINYCKNDSFKKYINNSLENKHFIVIYNISTPLENTQVNITFNGTNSFEPNGKYKLYVDAWRTYSDQRTPIKFNLGEYKCRNLCFGGYRNSETEINGKIINIKYPLLYYQGNDPKRLGQSLAINTIHQPSEKRKSNSDNLQIAFFVSSCVLLAEAIRFLMLYILSNNLNYIIKFIRKLKKKCLI
ncbi:MAG: hypothetical protein DRP06_00570 [Candidatus Aenigmatarchaeota archaeon]|nr:MAG: hypothetical protein DRP06_00570 [Candidatus Aenigmarchaeota archaeon]